MNILIDTQNLRYELLKANNYNTENSKACKVHDNLELRARNLKLYYWSMLGYPGEKTAVQLINHFCHFHKFDFGQWKGCCIGEIMLIQPSYIRWCINNVSTFKLNEEETALLNTSWKHSVGGYNWDITHNQIVNIPAEKPDYNLINLEKELLVQKETL